MSTKPRAWETPLVELLEGVPFDARMIYELSPTECLSIPVGLLCSKAAAALRQPAVPLTEARAFEIWERAAQIDLSGRVNELIRIKDAQCVIRSILMAAQEKP